MFKYKVFSGPYFPYSYIPDLRSKSPYSVRIQEIRARKYSVFWHFSRSDCFHFKGVRKRLTKKTNFLMITRFYVTSAMGSKADGQRNYLPLLCSKWYLVFNFPLPNISKIIQNLLPIVLKVYSSPSWTLFWPLQRRIQNPANNLRWSFLQKQLTAESR